MLGRLGSPELLEHVTAPVPNELLALAHHDDDHRLGVVDWLAAALTDRRFLLAAHARIIGICASRLQRSQTRPGLQALAKDLEPLASWRRAGARGPSDILGRQASLICAPIPLRLSCLGSEGLCVQLLIGAIGGIPELQIVGAITLSGGHPRV